ncbi:YceI family protein [Maricaulis parjimensis]|uniref:YceI family protein n=1 Tax=Maricaulis parjimensis TaxID=144023 RepID=UPI001939F91B|nr:YceI family protein [Maricaulis parjimensis]
MSRLLPALALVPVLALATACSQQAGGDWTLDAEASQLNFVSIKSGDIAEVHHFSGLSGSVSEDGQAELVIDLASVETGIVIRNERMREHLFETETYPTARLTAQIDLAALAAMAPGDQAALELDALLDLHGMQVPVYADVLVTDLDGSRVIVTTQGPVVLHAADFNLQTGLDTLQGLAGLPSITPAVPVSATLVFQRG